MTTDVRPLGYADGVEFCRDLPTRCGVVAIPHQVFYDRIEAGKPYVRWAFCKHDAVLDDALDRLATLRFVLTPALRLLRPSPARPLPLSQLRIPELPSDPMAGVRGELRDARLDEAEVSGGEGLISAFRTAVMGIARPQPPSESPFRRL